MKNLIIKSSLATLIVLATNTAMAFEQTNNENDYEAAFQNGWVDQTQLPVASFRDHQGHELKFNGGSEQSDAITSTFMNTDHHTSSNTSDPLSIDYMGNQ